MAVCLHCFAIEFMYISNGNTSFYTFFIIFYEINFNMNLQFPSICARGEAGFCAVFLELRLWALFPASFAIRFSALPWSHSQTRYPPPQNLEHLWMHLYAFSSSALLYLEWKFVSPAQEVFVGFFSVLSCLAFLVAQKDRIEHGMNALFVLCVKAHNCHPGSPHWESRRAWPKVTGTQDRDFWSPQHCILWTNSGVCDLFRVPSICCIGLVSLASWLKLGIV